MANVRMLNEYAKNKLTEKQLSVSNKNTEKELYSVMVDEGLQTIGEKTYTLETSNYIIAMTERNGGETVDLETWLLNQLGLDKKTATERAKADKCFKYSNGSVVFKVKVKE